MKIVYHPYGSGDNMYTDIILEGLRKRKFEIIPLDDFFSNYRDVKIIHLNWYENIASLLNFLNKTTKLIVFKILGKKIVWTMHNKEPHDNKKPSLQKAFRNLLIFFADTIIIHSLDSKGELSKKGKKIIDKTFYLPHPDYIDVYGHTNGISSTVANKTSLNLVFVGLVRPYKNLELLIDCVSKFGDKVKLTIAGKPKDDEYANSIREKAGSNPNIELDLRFIEDNRLISYIQHSDLVVLPYKMNSVLNSGTVILSFSYGRSVICPNIGTINDIHDKSAILNYSYTSENDHKKNLIDAIDTAVRLKEKSPEIFEKWGLQMKEYIIKYHDTDTVIDELAGLYHNIAK